MTKSQIYAQIRVCNNNISSYKRKIKACEDDIDDLEALKSKVTRTKADFQNQNKRRNNALSVLDNHNRNLKSVDGYYKKMHSVLNGSEYRKAINSLENSLDSIEKHKNQLSKNISQYRRNINYQENRRTYWYNQLKYAE